MAKLTIEFDGDTATVTADGSKASCSAADAVEKALGKVTSKKMTGGKSATGTNVQKQGN